MDAAHIPGELLNVEQLMHSVPLGWSSAGHWGRQSVRHQAFSVLDIREGHFLQAAAAKPGIAGAVCLPLIHGFTLCHLGCWLSSAVWKYPMKNCRNNLYVLNCVLL